MISTRLLAERKRLLRTQDDFASIGGVSKRAYCNYESGERECGSNFLAALAKIGVDVQYLLTGIYSANCSAVFAQFASQDPECLVDAKLAPRASKLLVDYERCTEPMKDAIDRTVRAMAERKKFDMALGVAQIGESLFIEVGKSKRR